MFSAQNTDSPNPFQPALQYLLSGDRASSLSPSIDSDPERTRGNMASRTGRSSNSSSSELQPNSIPLITFSRTPSPYPRKNSNPTSYASSEVEDDSFDDSSRRPFLSEGHQPVAKGWKGLLYGGGLGHWLFATAVGWQFYVGFLVFWLGGCAIGLILMNRIILLSTFLKSSLALRLADER